MAEFVDTNLKCWSFPKEPKVALETFEQETAEHWGPIKYDGGTKSDKLKKSSEYLSK